MKALLLSIVLTFFACSCTQPDPFQSAVELNVAEATLRFLIGTYAEGYEASHRAAVCIHNEDPGREFRSRFSDFKIHVVRCSASPRRNVLKSIHRRVIGQDIVEYWLHDITVESETGAKAVAGYYENGLSAAAISFELEQQNGVWVVVGHELLSIS